MHSFLFNLAGVGWRVSVLVVLVALLRPWLRRGIGSHGVALLWSVLAVRLLWPGLPESRWGLIHAAESVPAAETVRLAPVVPVAPVAPVVPYRASEAHGSHSAMHFRSPRLAPPERIVTTNVPVPARVAGKVTLLGWIVSGWAVGCCAVAAYFLWHLLAARRWSARTLPAADYPRLADAFAALPARVRGNLEVRVTRELDTPVLVGWLRPQIWVPASWVDRLGREELQHVLWHEAGHARRRDLPVQWLFAVACCVHWFNPLVWLLARWARDERELACDAWVCAQQGEPADFTAEYGRTLLRLITGARPRGLWPLAPATVAMAASLGHLRQRLREIAAFRPVPAWRGQTGALAGAMALAALTTVGTVSHAQETPAPAAASPATPSATPIIAGAGTITGRVVAEKTGEPLADVLVRAAVGEDADMRMNRHPDSGCLETRTDGNGEYRLSVPLSAGEHPVYLDALTPGYRSATGMHMIATSGALASVTLSPGGKGKYDFKLAEALYLKGVVVDDTGQPVRNAEIAADYATEHAYGGVAWTRTDADGRFEVFDFPLHAEADWLLKRLRVHHPDYIWTAIDDVYSLGKDEQTHLKLVLARGKQIAGTLLDASGKPAAGVEVTARPPGHDEPKRVVTDREGKFALRGLVANTDYRVIAHALPLKEKYRSRIRTDENQDGITLHLTPVVLTQPLKPIEVLGMQLVDMTDELGEVYDYGRGIRAALVVDPGQNSGRHGGGPFREGQVFCEVEDADYKGSARVNSVRDFVAELVKHLRRNEDGTFGCRVLSLPEPGATNARSLRVTEQEAQDLKALAARLAPEQPATAASPATPPSPPTATPASAQAGTITGRVVAETTGEPLANALVRAGVGKGVNMRTNRYPNSGCLETRTDRNGEYRLSVPLPAGEQIVKLDALTPGYCSLAGTMVAGIRRGVVTLAPGGTAKCEIKLAEALYLKGSVVDEADRPVPHTEIRGGFTMEDGYGGVGWAYTTADGQFEIFDYPSDASWDWKEEHLTALHDGYVSSTVANVYNLGKEERTHLKIVLAKGKQITGTLLDASGKPAAGVEVTARPPGDGEPKGSITDEEGKFAFRGLVANTDYLVTAHALALKQKYQAKMRTDADHDGLTLNLTPVVLTEPLKPIEVLGMHLVDLTDELRAVYDYDSKTKGALILDPGKDSGRLQCCNLAEGRVFWLVEDVDYKGSAQVAGVREFVDALVKDLRRNADGTFTCRVVYNIGVWGTSTRHLQVTEQESQDLKDLAAKLDAEQPAASPAASATPASAAASKG